MGYRYYSIDIVLCIVALIADAVATTLSVVFACSPLITVLLLLAMIIIVAWLWRLIRHPQEQIRHFLLSLRCGERMIRFPNTRDAVLNTMYGHINDIIKLYYENKLEIETKKGYYDRILRIMTHEIRNTITPLISLSEFYLDTGNRHTTEDFRQGMHIINSQGNNLKSFLDSYHALTHLPEPSLQRIHVPVLFHEIQQLMRCEPGGERIRILRTNVTLYADPAQMQLIIGNLLRNALHATEGYDDAYIELCASISGRQPFITVTDNGCGIPAERINDIFLPFYTTKQNGSGIGLALCRQIMLLHGGELTVESVPDKRHTMFTLLFPELPHKVDAVSKD